MEEWNKIHNFHNLKCSNNNSSARWSVDSECFSSEWPMITIEIWRSWNDPWNVQDRCFFVCSIVKHVDIQFVSWKESIAITLIRPVSQMCCAWRRFNQKWAFLVKQFDHIMCVHNNQWKSIQVNVKPSNINMMWLMVVKTRAKRVRQKPISSKTKPVDHDTEYRMGFIHWQYHNVQHWLTHHVS